MMQRFLLILLALPTLLPAQPDLERMVFTSAGDQHSSGTSFSIGEAMPLIGQNAATQLIATYQQGEAATDSVWPGDANDDFVADNQDLLAIGLAYGASGPSRTNASTLWQAQAASPWLQGLPNGVNYQHPDCNGDGLINDDDTLAIILNYGLVHQKNGETDSAGIPMVLSMEEDSVFAGQAIEINIFLGSDSMPVVNGYGLAFRLELDTSLVQTSKTSVLFSDSWLGNVAQDLLTLRQTFTVDDRIHLAMTRRDHLAQNGYGQVASVIIMIDDLSGKNGLSETLYPTITDPVLITAEGAQIPVNISVDSLVITDQSTWIPEHLAREIRLYPNPTNGRVEIDPGSVSVNHVRILDLQGRLIREMGGSSHVIRFDLTDLPQGSYLIEAHTDQGLWRETLLRR